MTYGEEQLKKMGLWERYKEIEKKPIAEGEPALGTPERTEFLTKKTEELLGGTTPTKITSDKYQQFKDVFPDYSNIQITKKGIATDYGFEIIEFQEGGTEQYGGTKYTRYALLNPEGKMVGSGVQYLQGAAFQSADSAQRALSGIIEDAKLRQQHGEAPSPFAKWIIGKEAQVPTGEVPTGEDKSTQDEILKWVSSQGVGYTERGRPVGFDTREQMIEQGVATYGEENRQFITDTIYRELRGKEEPKYEPPEYDVYEGEEEEEGEEGGGIDYDATQKRIDEIKASLEELTGKVGEIGEEEPFDWDKLTTTVTDLIDKRWAEKPDIEPFEWTDQDTAAVRAEFEELYEPYYAQMEATSKRGAREAIEEIAEAEQLAIKRQSRSLEEALTESRASMAARGLAFSGIRGKGEERAKDISAEQMQEFRDIAARGRRGELAGLEQQIGTAGVQQLYPGYQIAPEYAGLGIQFPRGTAIPGIPGAIPVQRGLDYEQELARRQAEARSTYLSDILMREYT